MHSIPKKYIVSGAPGTGKTTLINLLKKTIPCMDEVARAVIIEEQKMNSNGIPWEDLDRFSRLVFNNTQEQLSLSDAVVCDRSLLDLEAYFTLENKVIPSYLKNFPYREVYHKTVFFAPTWYEIYCKDGQRLQEFDYCVKLESALLQHYGQHGFEIVLLAKSTPSDRAKFLLESIL